MDSIITPVLPIILILGFISFVVVIAMFFKREKEAEQVDKRTYIYAYNYIVLFISLIFVVLGATLVIKSALSYQFGIDFSFRGTPQYEEVKTPYDPSAPYIEPKIIGITYEEHVQAKAMLQGVITLVFSLLFFVLHYLSIKKINKEFGEHVFLKKSYLLMSTLVFGGIFVFVVPTSIYYSLSAYLFRPENLAEYYKNYYSYNYNNYIPGESIGLAIMSGLAWIGHLKEFMGFRTRHKNDK